MALGARHRGTVAVGLCVCLLALYVPADAEERVAGTPSVDVLVDHVRNGTGEEFDEALRVLSERGAAAAAAVPFLIDNLDPPDDARRAKLARTLASIGEPAVPALTRGLMSWSGHTRTWCTYTLGRMGALAAPAVPLLVESLDGAHPDTQVELLRALAGIGEPAADAVPAVRKLLASDSGTVRVEAVRTLGHLGADAISVLVDVAAGDDAAMAEAARQALGRSFVERPGPSAATLERLGATLRKGSETLRIEAARAIGVLGPRAVALLPALEAALRDESALVRRAVIRALAALGPAASGTLEGLRTLLATDAAVRQDVLRALPFLGPDAGKAIPDVSGWLADPGLRHVAAEALVRYGDAGVAELVEAVRHASFRTREVAVKSLGGVERSIGGRLPALVGALEDPSSSVRYAACDALGSLGALARNAVPALRRRLADEAEGVRVAAARALFEAGERGAELAPALIEGLTSRTIWLFEDMDERLVVLGAAAVPALAQAMAHMQAVGLGEVCARIGKPAIPAMLRGLENAKPSARRASLEALRAVEADGGFLLAPIAARLKDEDWTVRAAAARALVPFARTCPEALVERALPDLLAFLDRSTYYSDEEQAVHAALVAIGRPALPALYARLEQVEEPDVRQLVHTIESAE